MQNLSNISIPSQFNLKDNYIKELWMFNGLFYHCILFHLKQFHRLKCFRSKRLIIIIPVMDQDPNQKSFPHKNLERAIRFVMAIFAAHFIVINGTSYDLLELLADRSYYVEMAFSSVVALVIVTWISTASQRLDTRYGWTPNWLRRTVLQTILGIVVPVIFEYAVTGAYFKLLLNVNILKTPFFYNEFRTVILMICFFNLYCISRYFYLQWRATEHALTRLKQQVAYSLPNTIESDLQTDTKDPEVSLSKEVVVVHTALRTIPIPVAEIAYFYRANDHVFLRTFNAEDHQVSRSLDFIEEIMDSQLFFRISRHMVINFKAIVDYRPLSYGKTAVSLTPPYREQVKASKLLARRFRTWVDR
jgi:hypothetical protein